MADMIQVQHSAAAAVVYALIRDSAGAVWNGSTFETYATANIGTYDVAMTEQGTASRFYAATVPGLAAGVYSFVAFVRAGGSPAETDTAIAAGEAEWTGIAFVLSATQASVDAVDTVVDAILVDTAEIGAAGAGLTNINLPNQTMDIVGNITGSLSGSVGSVTGAVGSVTGAVGSVTGAVGSVTGNVGGNVTGSVASVVGAVGSVASGGIVAASFAPDAITAATLAADVTTELQTGLATAASITALNNLSAAQVNAEVDTALSDIHLDHLLAATYDPASKPGVVDALLNELVESDSGVARYTANALEQAPTGGAAPTVSAIADEVQTRTIAAVTTVNGLAANVVTAAALAADAGSEIASAVRTNLTTELGRIDAMVSSRATQTSVDDVPTNAEMDARTLVAASYATSAGVSAVEADTQDIQTRLPAALVSGRMSSDVVAISSSTVAADKLEAHAGAVSMIIIGTGSTPTSIVLDPTTGVDGAAPPSGPDVFNRRVLVITSGALNRQAQTVDDYDGTGPFVITLVSPGFTGSAINGVTAVLV